MTHFTRRQFLLTLSAGILSLGSYEFTQAYRIQLERHELLLPNWEADEFCVALLGDIHLRGHKEIERAIAAFEIAIKANPDVILLVGDLFDSSWRSDPKILDQHFELLYMSGIPTFAVLGNHEYDLPNPQIVIDYIKKTPIKLLQNETVDIHGVTILGVDDPMSGCASYEGLDFSKLSKSTLCLMHEPDFCAYFPKPQSISLQLSGHSHGGQICLPFGIPIRKNPGSINYTAGYYPTAPMPLYVTRGVGTTTYDIRLFCPPEVTILTLKGVKM